MCRMRETNYGSVPAECFGPSMARRVRPLLRLQNHVAGQVFLKGSEAILQRGFLQVSNRSYQLLHLLFFFPPLARVEPSRNDGRITGYLSLPNLERVDDKDESKDIDCTNDFYFSPLTLRWFSSIRDRRFFTKNRGNESYHSPNISILKIETLYSNQSCNSNSNSRKLINYFDYVYIYIYTRIRAPDAGGKKLLIETIWTGTNAIS